MSSGSIWRKWDLHIHTPGTKLNDNYIAQDMSIDSAWDAYCDLLHASDVEVFGITDYFSADNYYEFIHRYRIRYPECKKIFFPNIEFRLDVAVNKAGEEVNLHVIFDSAHCTEREINNFLVELKTSLTDVNGRAIPCSEIPAEKFVAATVQHKQLTSALDSIFASKNCYLIVGASNNAGLRADSRSPRKLSLSDEIDKVCHCFFGGSQNVQYFLSTSRYEDGQPSIPKPVLGGSDCHSFDDIRNFLGKQFERSGVVEKTVTWIKADPTFEGLRQVLFEPQHRIHLANDRPFDPPKSIRSIRLEIPAQLKVRHLTGTEEPFCFSGFTGTINFNPCFTSLIGGRGTGKSTLLSIVHKAFDREATNSLFKNSKFILDGQPVNFSDFVTIDQSTDEIEYLQQNEIEKFATDPREFTAAIYSRLKRRNSRLKEHELTIDAMLKKADEVISLIKNSRSIEDELFQINKSIESNRKIAEAMSSPEYLELTNSLKATNSRLQKYKTGRERIVGLADSIETLLENHPKLDQLLPGLSYDQKYNAVIDGMRGLKTAHLDPAQFLDLVTEEELLERKLSDDKAKLSHYLMSVGVSNENLEDIQNSSIITENLQAESERKRSELKRMRSEIHAYDQTLLERAYREALADTERDLNQVKDILQEANRSNPEEVDKIDLEIDANMEAIRQSVIDEFLANFSAQLSKYKISTKLVKDALFNVDLKELVEPTFQRETLVEKISGGNQYNKFLEEVFNVPSNFQVYRMIVHKHLHDFKKTIHIVVKYRQRPLDQASFGQRCTAVIVILLMFGNTPIIIDEPEAHLDSALIANYLINLIKDKKRNRQIIFATHNANFVINADCDLINILDMPVNTTSLSETTIENLSSREKLLALEGGLKAFHVRERKYNLA